MLHRDSLARLVRVSRNKRGLTQHQLADKSEKPVSWVRDVERGKTIPSDFHSLYKLAWALDLDPVTVNAYRLEALHSSRLSDAALRAERDEPLPGFLYLSDDELSRYSYSDPRYSDSDLTELVKAPPKKAADLEADAESLAESLAPFEVEEGQAIPIAEIVEDGDRLMAAVNRGSCALDLELENSRAEGSVRFEADGRFVMSIPAHSFEAAKWHDDGRVRFTLAHEVAHIAIHGDMLERNQVRMFRDPFVTASAQLPPGMKIYESPEWQANTWASAFLMPARALREFLKGFTSAGYDDDFVGAIAEQFHVSYQAAQIRVRKVLPRLLAT